MPAMSPIATTGATPVAFADGVNLDAFGRLRVSQPANLFDSKLTYDLAPLSWQSIVTGSGSATHLPAEAACQMRVTGDGDSVIRQTYGYMPYRPGGETIYKGYAVGGGVNTGSGKALDFRSLGITDQNLILALDHAGQNPIGLSIVVTGIGGTASVAGSLTWTEVR